MGATLSDISLLTFSYNLLSKDLYMQPWLAQVCVPQAAKVEVTEGRRVTHMQRRFSKTKRAKKTRKSSRTKPSKLPTVTHTIPIYPSDPTIGERWWLALAINVGAHIANAIDRAARAMGEPNGIGPSVLTPIQMELIALHNQGFSPLEISRQLGVSEDRIKEIEALLRSRYTADNRVSSAKELRQFEIGSVIAENSHLAARSLNPRARRSAADGGRSAHEKTSAGAGPAKVSARSSAAPSSSRRSRIPDR
jgi:DNA-binding CsgD family transcriptional regulator